MASLIVPVLFAALAATSHAIPVPSSAPAVGLAAKVKAWIKREQRKVRTPKAPKDLRTTQVPVP